MEGFKFTCGIEKKNFETHIRCMAEFEVIKMMIIRSRSALWFHLRRKTPIMIISEFLVQE